MSEDLAGFLPTFQRRLGMYVAWKSFAEVCAFLTGYETATGGHLISGFQSWLGQRSDQPELGFAVHVLREAFPDHAVSGRLSLLHPRELTDVENEHANATLFRLLHAYLADQGNRQMGESRTAHSRYAHLYVVIRIDDGSVPGEVEDRISPVSAFANAETAQAEVSRLNDLNRDRGAHYVLFTTRLKDGHVQSV